MIRAMTETFGIIIVRTDIRSVFTRSERCIAFISIELLVQKQLQSTLKSSAPDIDMRRTVKH